MINRFFRGTVRIILKETPETHARNQDFISFEFCSVAV